MTEEEQVRPDEKPILERVERVLAELSRAIAAPDINQSPEPRYIRPINSAEDAGLPAIRLAAANSWISARKARDDAFGDDLFFDPAWSILLELYLHHRQRTAVSVTSLCLGAKIPPSTGLRWMAVLEKRGLIVRESDPFDRRKIYAELTAEGINRLEKAIDTFAKTAQRLGIEHSRPFN